MTRATLCTPEMTLAICTRLAAGEKMAKICRDPEMPERSTVVRWLASSDPQYAEFQKAHALARCAGTYVMADEIIEIADDTSNDVIPGEEGEPDRVNHEHIQRSKLKVDTRKWLMGKFNAAAFGDSIAVGGVPGAPIETKDVSDPQSRDILRRIAFALAGGAKAQK